MRAATRAPAHQPDVPVLRALPPHVRREERRLRPRTRGPAQGRGPGAGAGGPRDRRADRQVEGPSRPALRRPAAAGRARASHRQEATAAPPRRAALSPRPQGPRRDAARAEAAAARGRDHLRGRHPRPGGGHVDGRPDRRHARRPGAAGRYPGGPLPPARQHVRRGLHRLQQLLRRHAHRRGRGRARARQPSGARRRPRPGHRRGPRRPPRGHQPRDRGRGPDWPARCSIPSSTGGDPPSPSRWPGMRVPSRSPARAPLRCAAAPRSTWPGHRTGPSSSARRPDGSP